MKKMLFPISACVSQSTFRHALGGAVVASLIMMSPVAQAVTDDFSDGNDTLNPTWTHLSGLANSTGQAWFVGGGTNPPAAYRLVAPNNGYSSYGFVGSYTGPSMNDTTVSADFIVHAGNGLNGVYGIGARLDGNNAFNGLKGYGYAYEPFAASGAGEMVLYKINGLSLQDVGSQGVSLNSAKDYTFILEVTGNTLHGQVWEIGGGMVAEKFFVDPTPYTTGYSGVLGYSATGYSQTDFTIDNFVAVAVPEPSAMALAGLGLLGLTTMWNARRAKRNL